MFSTAHLYRFATATPWTLEDLRASLARGRFLPCLPSQHQSRGWVSPRGNAHDGLAEKIEGHIVLHMMVETKAVPAEAVQRRATELLTKMQAESGRKPGKSQIREMKEQVFLELLPQAFARRQVIPIWLDLDAGVAAVGALATTAADEAVTCLVAGFPGLTVRPFQTNTSPEAGMSEWLVTQEPPAGFSVDRECELRSDAESGAAIRYSRHALDIDEVKDHVLAGKKPTQVAMTWRARVSFVLMGNGRLAKIKVITDFAVKSPATEDAFDADWLLFAGELRPLVQGLEEALGGELITLAESPGV